MACITLTTDFGSDSPYVAAMKGVILSINPAASVVDISHSVPAQDIRAGAIALGDTYRWFPPGSIHVGVVDPGVGTDRRIVCLVGNGHLFVGPDNGLLTFAAGPAPDMQAFEISHPRFRLAEVSNTFHGRDIMAPAAAHLSLGAEPEQLGRRLDDWVRLDLPHPRQVADQIEGEVLLVDHFGNLITNITHEVLSRLFGSLEDVASQLTISCGGHHIRGLVRTYGQVEAGTPVALMGSSGRLEVAVVNGNAAAELGVCCGVGVRIGIGERPASP